VGLERGPLSLVSTSEERSEGESSGSCLENQGYGRRGFAALTTLQILYPQKLVLTSPTSGGRSVSIVRLLTKATEFSFDCLCGLVVRVPRYRSRGPGSIPVATGFSEK
jgi:hypothetical protein